MSPLRTLTFLAATIVLSLMPLYAQATESAAKKAMKTRTIEPCGLDCGTLILVNGREVVFRLNFSPNAGANGISIGNPKVITSTLVKIGSSSDKGPADKYELALRAISEGKASITIRALSGETAAHFDVVVEK